MTDPAPRPLTKREQDVLKAMAPHLAQACQFNHTRAAASLRMTRQLFNLYLTKLTRAYAIVRIAPGCYVLPEDPRANGPLPLPRARTRPKDEPKPEKGWNPVLLPGITKAMLMAGRAPRRARVG